MNRFYKHPMLWGLGGALLALSAHAQVKVGDNPTTLAPNTVFQVEKGGNNVVISNSGSIGIGTTTPSPGIKLDVIGGAIAVRQQNNFSGYYAVNTSNDPSAHPFLTMFRSRGTLANLQYPQSGDVLGAFVTMDGVDPNAFGGTRIQSYASENFSATAKGSRMEFLTTLNGSTALQTKMTIADNGYVGIGTTTPAQKFEVFGGASQVANDGGSNFIGITGSGTDPQMHASVVLGTARGTVGNLQYAKAGDFFAGFFGRDAKDFGTAQNWGSVIYMQATEDQGPANKGTRMLFNINNNGSAQTSTAMVLDQTGNLAIGAITPTEKLHVAGNILATGSITPSDRRFKQNIQPLLGTLGKLGQVRGVSYTHTEQAIKDRSLAKGNQIGFIAQELEAIFPEFVVTSSDGYKAVDYARLTPVLVEAIKELTQKNSELSANYSDLKAEMASIKALLQASTPTTGQGK